MPSIGRLFYEVGAKNTVPADLAAAVKSFESFGETVSASGRRYLSNFQQFINPTRRLGEELALLEKAGAKPAEMLSYLGDRFQKGVDQARKFGETIPKNVLELEAFAKAGEKSGMSFKGLGEAITNFARNPLQAMESGMSGLLESIGPVAVGIGGVATAAITGGIALLKFAADTADTAEQLQNLSIQTGLTTQDLQALQQVGRERGLELDLAKQLGRLNKELADTKGTGSEFVRTLNALRYAQGLPAADLSKGLIPALVELRERVLDLPEGFERAKVQSAALGKGMQSLQPILFDTNKSIADFIEEAKKSDAVWGTDAQAKLMAFDDLLDSLGRTWKGLKNDIAIATVNALQWFNVIETKGASTPSTMQIYEQWAKAGKGLPEFGKSQFVNVGGVEGDPFKNVQAELARLDAIASGEKIAIELRIKLKQLEEEYAAAKKDNDVAEATRLAEKISGLKSQISVQEEAVKAAKKEAEHQTELNAKLDKMIVEWDSVGNRVERASKRYEDINGIWKVSIEIQKDLSQYLQRATKDLEDMTQAASEAMAKGDKNIFKDQMDALPKFTSATEKEMNRILRVNTDTGKSIADVWKRQVSTITSDFARGFSDILFAGKSFGETLKNIFIDMAKSIIRALMETLFVPIQRYLVQVLGGLMGMGTAAASTGGGAASVLNPNGLAGGNNTLSGWAGVAAGGGIAVAGMFQKGVAGWAETIGGGAMAGAAIGTYLLPGIGTALGAALGAAAGAIAKGIQAMVKAFMGPSTIQAAAEEAVRDLGGTKLTEGIFKSFISQFMDPKQAWGIRKDIMFSPKFLSEVAGPQAEAQGNYPSFLKSLENVKTSFGTFNFREAFETGKASGDWSELNKQFVAAFKNSQELLRVLPDFANILAASADATWNLDDATAAAVKGLTSIRDAIAGSIQPIQTMYDKFAQTGEITDEFAAKIKELGGNLEKFQELASLIGQQSALKDQLGTINDLIGRFQALQPAATAIDDLFRGVLNTEGLIAKGLDPEKFRAFADLTSMMQGWQPMVAQFQQTGAMSSGIQQALSQYGGAAGSTALSRYASGFNTITPGLLSSTYERIQQAYQSEISNALSYLGAVQKDTSTQLDIMTSEIETAKQDLVTELDLILQKITEVADNTAAGGAGPTIVVNGGNFYGPDDFVDQVGMAWIAAQRRGQFSGVLP